jgi:hypothetical protein
VLCRSEAVVPDVAVIFGFVWAGLMFVSATLNVVVALNFGVVAWSAFMSIYAIVSKAAPFLIGYATMRYIGVRRRRNQMIPALASLGLTRNLPAQDHRRPSASVPTEASGWQFT